MTSTNDVKEVKSNQTSGQKGKSYYIDLYKSLDAELNEAGDAFAVCEAWRKVHTLCLHSSSSTHHHLLSWILRHTAQLILQSEWQSSKHKADQKQLEDALDAFSIECHAAIKARPDGASAPWEQQLLQRVDWLRKNLAQPWDHPVLRGMLNSSADPPTTENILEWLKEEHGMVFVTRLRQLTASKCDDLASELASAVMERVRAQRTVVPDADQVADHGHAPVESPPGEFENILRTKAGFSTEVWDLLTDIEFVLLQKRGQSDKVIELAKQAPLSSAYQLVERLQGRLTTSPRDKKLWKNAKDVAILIAQVVIARCMVLLECVGACRGALYWSARLLARLLPRDELARAAQALAKPASSARHLHIFATAVHAQLSESGAMNPFVCELYVRAINFGMNELEKLKLMTEKEAEARNMEATLASWFVQLGQLLAGSARMRGECTLTAFSLHPSQVMFDRVKATEPLPKAPIPATTNTMDTEPSSEFGSWATDSRSQTNFVKTSETLNLKHTKQLSNILSTTLLNEGEVLGLSPELCQDIAVLLSGPRVKTLSWDMDRNVLLENCRTYMERTHGGTRSLTTELKYLNIDYSKYQHLKEEEDNENDIFYGIEKGYEHHIEFEPQPEEIWQDAIWDLERTEADDYLPRTETDDENDEYLPSHSRRTVKQESSEDESDPLSLVAEAKRSQKKERPHSKERSRDREQSKKTHSRSISKERKHDRSSSQCSISSEVLDNRDSKDIKETSHRKERNQQKPKERSHSKEKKTKSKDSQGKERKERKKKEKKEKDNSMAELLGVKVANYDFVTKTSQADSQGLSSIKSEDIDPRVQYDGQFSMDELKLKSPNKPINSAAYQASLCNRSELSIANRNIGINTSLSPTNPCNIRPQFTSDSMKISIDDQQDASALKEQIRQSISKLIQFRKRKDENTQRSVSMQNVPLDFSKSATQTVLPTPQTVQSTPLVLPSPMANLLGSKIVKAPQGTTNKTENKQLNPRKDVTKTKNAPRRTYQKQNKSDDSSCSRLIPFSLHAKMKAEKPRNLLKPSPVLLNAQCNEILNSVVKAEPKAEPTRPGTHLSSYEQFLKDLQTRKDAGIFKPKPSEVTDHFISRPRKELKPMSRVTPVMPRATNNGATKPDTAVPNKVITNVPTRPISNTSSILIKSTPTLNVPATPTVLNIPKKVQKPETVTSQSAKKQQKKTDDALNTFARRSFMHKNKQVESSKPPADPLVELNEEISAELDKRVAAFQVAKLLQEKTDIVVNRITNEAKKSQSVKNPVLANILNSKSMANTTGDSGVTEKDDDILALLREQSRTPQPQYGTTVTKSDKPEKKPTSQQQQSIENLTKFIKSKVTAKTKVPPTYNNYNNYLQVNKSISKTYSPSSPQVESFKPSEAVGSSEHNWTEVMDMLRAQKTPNRGPNAVDLLMNQDSFQKYTDDKQGVAFTQVISVSEPGKTGTAQNQDVPVLHLPDLMSVVDAITPTKQIDKSVKNVVTAESPCNKQATVHHTKMRATEKRIGNVNDPIIAGIPNSEYEILEELIDDELRREIMSDEEGFPDANRGPKSGSNAKKGSLIVKQPNMFVQKPEMLIKAPHTAVPLNSGIKVLSSEKVAIPAAYNPTSTYSNSNYQTVSQPNVAPPNVFVAVPQVIPQPSPNVVVIGSDVVCDPFTVYCPQPYVPVKRNVNVIQPSVPVLVQNVLQLANVTPGKQNIAVKSNSLQNTLQQSQQNTQTDIPKSSRTLQIDHRDPNAMQKICIKPTEEDIKAKKKVLKAYRPKKKSIEIITPPVYRIFPGRNNNAVDKTKTNVNNNAKEDEKCSNLRDFITNFTPDNEKPAKIGQSQPVKKIDNKFAKLLQKQHSDRNQPIATNKVSTTKQQIFENQPIIAKKVVTTEQQFFENSQGITKKDITTKPVELPSQNTNKKTDNWMDGWMSASPKPASKQTAQQVIPENENVSTPKNNDRQVKPENKNVSTPRNNDRQVKPENENVSTFINNDRQVKPENKNVSTPRNNDRQVKPENENVSTLRNNDRLTCKRLALQNRVINNLCTLPPIALSWVATKESGNSGSWTDPAIHTTDDQPELISKVTEQTAKIGTNVMENKEVLPAMQLEIKETNKPENIVTAETCKEPQQANIEEAITNIVPKNKEVMSSMQATTLIEAIQPEDSIETKPEVSKASPQTEETVSLVVRNNKYVKPSSPTESNEANGSVNSITTSESQAQMPKESDQVRIEESVSQAALNDQEIIPSTQVIEKSEAIESVNTQITTVKEESNPCSPNNDSMDSTVETSKENEVQSPGGLVNLLESADLKDKHIKAKLKSRQRNKPVMVEKKTDKKLKEKPVLMEVPADKEPNTDDDQADVKSNTKSIKTKPDVNQLIPTRVSKRILNRRIKKVKEKELDREQEETNKNATKNPAATQQTHINVAENKIEEEEKLTSQTNIKKVSTLPKVDKMNKLVEEMKNVIDVIQETTLGREIGKPISVNDVSNVTHLKQCEVDPRNKQPTDNIRNKSSNKSINKTTRTEAHNIPERFQYPNSYTLIPQSYKDSILFKEVPSRDPNKKLIRITLPNGKVFRVTIFGQVSVSFDMLYDDPNIREILQSGLCHTSCYTLNVHKTREVISKVSLVGPSNRTPIETVDLISDDENETPDMCFATEFGVFKTMTIEKSSFDRHQAAFSKQCVVKLEVLPTPVKVEPVSLAINKSKTCDLVDLREDADVAKETIIPDVIELDDSSDDCTILPDKVCTSEIALLLRELGVVGPALESPIISVTTIETPNSTPEPVTTIETPTSTPEPIAETHCISEIPKCIAPFVENEECGNNAVETKTKNLLEDVDAQDNTEQRERTLTDKTNEELELIAKINSTKSVVELVRCDELLKSYHDISLCEDNDITAPEDTNVEEELSRSGSFSILNDLAFDDEPIDNGDRNSPVTVVFETICYLRDTRALETSSPVMEAYDMIVTAQNLPKLLENDKGYHYTPLAQCSCEWFTTKSSMHYQSMAQDYYKLANDDANRNLDSSNAMAQYNYKLANDDANRTLDSSTDCDSDLEDLDSSKEETGIGTKHCDVPTLKTTMAEYFKDNPLVFKLQPFYKTEKIKFASSPLKRKLLVKEAIHCKTSKIKAYSSDKYKDRPNKETADVQPSNVHMEMKLIIDDVRNEDRPNIATEDVQPLDVYEDKNTHCDDLTQSTCDKLPTEGIGSCNIEASLSIQPLDASAMENSHSNEVTHSTCVELLTEDIDSCNTEESFSLQPLDEMKPRIDDVGNEDRPNISNEGIQPLDATEEEHCHCDDVKHQTREKLPTEDIDSYNIKTSLSMQHSDVYEEVNSNCDVAPHSTCAKLPTEDIDSYNIEVSLSEPPIINVEEEKLCSLPIPSEDKGSLEMDRNHDGNEELKLVTSLAEDASSNNVIDDVPNELNLKAHDVSDGSGSKNDRNIQESESIDRFEIEDEDVVQRSNESKANMLNQQNEDYREQQFDDLITDTVKSGKPGTKDEMKEVIAPDVDIQLIDTKYPYPEPCDKEETNAIYYENITVADNSNYNVNANVRKKLNQSEDNRKQQFDDLTSETVISCKSDTDDEMKDANALEIDIQLLDTENLNPEPCDKKESSDIDSENILVADNSNSYNAEFNVQTNLKNVEHLKELESKKCDTEIAPEKPIQQSEQEIPKADCVDIARKERDSKSLKDVEHSNKNGDTEIASSDNHIQQSKQEIPKLDFGDELNHSNENIDWIGHETEIESGCVSTELDLEAGLPSIVAKDISETVNSVKIVQTDMMDKYTAELELLDSSTDSIGDSVLATYKSIDNLDYINNEHKYICNTEVTVENLDTEIVTTNSEVIADNMTDADSETEDLDQGDFNEENLNSAVILKGIEYEVPEVGICYVFRPIKTSGTSTPITPCDVLDDSFDAAADNELDETKDTVDDKYYDEDLRLIEPVVTYMHAKKRKSNSNDSYINVKRKRTPKTNLRKSKNIDTPKMSTSAVKSLSCSQQYARLLTYSSAISLSFTVPHSIDIATVTREEPKIVTQNENELFEPPSIKQSGTQDCEDKTEIAYTLFESPNFELCISDPTKQTLSEEITNVPENTHIETEPKNENSSMGFGERSGGVLQNLDDDANSKFSAATLSDVKHAQPFLLSRNHDHIYNTRFQIIENRDQLEKIRSSINYFEMREKVRNFFKNTAMELNSCNKEYKKEKASSASLFDLCTSNHIEPAPVEVVAQVVQVGQLPVSAAAQNPVTCDPRVTQVSDASPPQCSVNHSTQDDSQPEMKTEYTELTTARISLPALMQEYAQQSQEMDAQDSEHAQESSLIPVTKEVISSTERKVNIETEMKDENSDESEQGIPEDQAEEPEPVYNSEQSNGHDTNTESQPKNNDEPEQNPPDVCSAEKLPETSAQEAMNGSPDKKDQIAHAMNAAGISTTTETITNSKTTTNALVNLLSQLKSTATSTQSSLNSGTKTISAMSLQQALAQILPPPLNQTNTKENHQNQNPMGPQVLHIVQGKTASGSQITLVDNSQPSVINSPNATPVLHIVQNKPAGTGSNSSCGSSPQPNSFSGLSLVEAGLQQGGNQLLHIVNTGNQKNSSAGQILKRVNLVTNLTNIQGSNEQKMVQFVCKSADGKSIQLNAPHQRGMVLRLQPIETPNVQPAPQKPSENQEMNSTQNPPAPHTGNDTVSQPDAKLHSIYDENYKNFENAVNESQVQEQSTSLPKFGQAFGKQVYQDGSPKENNIENDLPVNMTVENSENGPPSGNNLQQTSSPPLVLRKPQQNSQIPSNLVPSQSPPNLVQHIKQAMTPMNIQTMHGGVIYTRQIPVNITGGQTINLITVPTTDLLDESGKKQTDVEPSIIQIVPQASGSTAEGSTNEGNNQNLQSNENGQNPPLPPQQVLTQMRIKLPMLSKAPQMVPGARMVRPSFFQIQRNVIGGNNQPVYQQLVLTTAPQLGQQTIRIPQTQTRPVKVDSQSSESHMSSSTLEQLREFDMVLEQVIEERTTGQPNPNSQFKLNTPNTDTTDSAVSTSSAPTETTQVFYSINNQPVNVTYVNRKAAIATPSTSSFVRSPDSSGIIESPSSSNHVQIPQTVTPEPSTSETVTNTPPKPKSDRKKSKHRVHHNSIKAHVPPKMPLQKPVEDEQTTQRILYILAEYKEQVENSPDKDKPAPRRRTNLPSNPSKRRRNRKSGTRDTSPVNGDDSCRTYGSEDSSCGTSQGDCADSCLESHSLPSPQESPRKIARKLTFDQESPLTPAPTPPATTPQPPRNVIVADGQTITVARGTSGGKPTATVLMPANYLLPVSMVKGGPQIAFVTNRGPKILTVGGDGGATNALLLQRLIGPAGLKPVAGVRHVRLPTAALQNLQAFNIAPSTNGADSSASPASTSTPPELDTQAASSPWTDRASESAKPSERASSPEGSEPWHLPTDYSYEETVRAENMDRTVLDPIPDRSSPDMEAQRIFDKMFDAESRKSYGDSPRCGYDIDPSECEDKSYQVVQRRDGNTRRLTQVAAATLRHKYAILEHELRLQKSLSEECEDLGVDSPSAAELFPEADLLFGNSPAHDHAQDAHHSNTPQPTIINQSVIQPDIDDQIATDHLLQPNHHQNNQIDNQDLGVGLEDVGIVTISEDGLVNIALDQEEFARSHPNTTFHREPTDDGVVQVQPPFTISGIRGRQISTIFHANRAPTTVLMAAPQTTVISQATNVPHVKYDNIDNVIDHVSSLPVPHNNNLNLSSVLVKDDGLSRFDSILTDSRELHLSNTASTIVHNNATQVIKRVCYDEKRDTSFLMDEPDALIAGDDAKMIAEDSRDATLLTRDVDDDNSSPERHAELFWESNSASGRSEDRRPLDFSSDSDKCCKSPSYDTNSTDSSGVGTHMRLDSVIKDARLGRSGSAGSSLDDNHPPLRTYPPKRMFHNMEGDVERSLSGKTRAGERSPDLEVRRRASVRGVVKRGCHCCNGSPTPQRPKKPRQRKPTLDFTTHN